MIYLNKKRKLLSKIIIFILLFIFIYGIGYLVSYLRFDDKKLIETRILMTENETLKKELEDIRGIDEVVDSQIGKVFIRNMYDFYDEVVIKVKGDVELGSAVINEEGLVGVIYKIENNLAYTKLLSSDYNVSVRVGDTYGNLSNGSITLLDKYSEINEGDLVYTSGLNEIPKDIYVGVITKVTMDSDNLGKKVDVKLIDNNYLNYVGVIKVK